MDEDQCYKLSLMRETRQPDKETKRKSIFANKEKTQKPTPAQASQKNPQAQQQV